MKGNIGIIGLIAIVVVIALLIVPGLGQSVISTITGTSASCEVSSYNSDCVCSEGQRKISVPWLGVPRWSCENLELLLIDPESPTFESDAITFTTNYLEYYCGSVCTDLSCGGNICDGAAPNNEENNPCIAAVYGYSASGERIANIECTEITAWSEDGGPKSGRILWRMQFFVESETDTPKSRYPKDNYCVNPEVTDRCEVPVTYIPTASIFSSVAPQLGSGYPSPV